MNNTQRNMLDKIIRDEYQSIRKELRQAVDSEFETAKQKILDNFTNKHKKLMNAVNKVNELWAESKNDFSVNGVELDGLSEKGANVRFKYYYRGDNVKNKELLQLELRKEDALKVIDDAENKIRKTIWGEDLDYDTMKASVDDLMDNLRTTARKFSNDRTKP